MRYNMLISLAIILIFLISCDKDMHWINANDPQADSAEIAKICEKAQAECGYIKTKADDGKFHEIFCGDCETGYRCGGNKCYDIDECANSSLNDCNNEVSTCANEEGSYSCICKENYSGDDCVPNTRTKECSGLPENAEWNTASSITQTWNGTNWEPANAGIYGEIGSTNECIFKCKENYNWDLGFSVCEAATRTADCTGLPENAEWNGTSNLMQTWNGDEWIPSSEATFSKTPGECTFKCSTGFYWNESKCEVAPTQTVDCAGLPENAHWNSSSTIIQTWDGDEWLPNNIGVYGENEGENECKFKCNSNYFWNGSECKKQITLGNICTGQTKCYNNTEEITCPTSSSDDFFGQDAQYTSKCTQQSFTVQIISNQKVVVDNNTGLMWEQSPSEDLYTWNDAPNHCADLNSSNYGGKSNWRVPNPLEFMTIVDDSKYNPATNSNFTNMPTSYSTYLWTSAEYKGNTSYAYAFIPYDAGYYGYPSDSYLKTKTYKVLCVNGDEMQPATSVDFTTQTISEADVVTDSKTGLMWQKEYVAGKTWQEALKYCEDLTYAGYSDWRLPNENELHSLVNYEKSGSPYSDFPDMPSSSFWSSSTRVYSAAASAWLGNFYHASGDSSTLKSSTSHVRCVR